MSPPTESEDVRHVVSSGLMTPVSSHRTHLLERWLVRVRDNQSAHWENHNLLIRRHYTIGIPATIFSTIVGTSIFASLDKSSDLDIKVKVAVACVAVVAAILSGLQTFWRFTERAEQHRKSAIAYANVRTELEKKLADPLGIDEKSVDDIAAKLNSTRDAAPAIDLKAWNRKHANNPNSDFFVPSRQPNPDRQS